MVTTIFTSVLLLPLLAILEENEALQILDRTASLFNQIISNPDNKKLLIISSISSLRAYTL
jgi:hypothetical protein